MPLKSINMLINAKLKREYRDELIYRVINGNLDNLVNIGMQGKAKIKDLGEILNEFDNPIVIETEEEIIAKVEKAFGGKIKR